MEQKHNPAITAAILQIKAELQHNAQKQRESKDRFRSEMSAWDKTGRRGDPPRSSHIATRAWITALHIVYQKLRQTKRPHLKDVAKWNESNGQHYRDARMCFLKGIPEALLLVPENPASPSVRTIQDRSDIPDLDPDVVRMVAEAK